jgi:signal transduction histidine kinase
VSLASRDPSALAGDLAARRRMLLSGLAVASLLALIGTYAVTRAVNRELAVARVQSDFVAAVSHEFRTPLTSIRQLSELLASDRVPTEERRHAYYTLMRQESVRLHRLVEGLLDFGRMEAGAHEFRFEPLEAGELVRGVVQEFQAEPAGREHPIELVDCATSCPVRADREALSRAIWNLLDNAAKYSPQDRPVTVSLSRDNGRVGITVADRGPGIAPEEQAQVFEKFIRGQEARASGVRGTGLGLAMVRQIARAHQGEITLRSTKGQGSAFTLSLPAEEPG